MPIWGKGFLDLTYRAIRLPRRPWGLGAIHHVARLRWRVMRQIDKTEPVAAKPMRANAATPLRIGVMGHYAHAPFLPLELFQDLPPDVEVFLYDIASDSPISAYAELSNYYTCANLLASDGKSQAEKIANISSAVNAADLDLLFTFNHKDLPYRVYDQIETPCIASYYLGGMMLTHERMGFCLYPEPQADYFLKGNSLFCAVPRTIFGSELFYPAFLYLDLRGIEPTDFRTWQEREPLMVFHGRLSKIAPSDTLDCILELLAEDSALSFAYMGSDPHDFVSMIEQRARQKGVQSRVFYEGQFRKTRDANGFVTDPGWKKCLNLLQRARLMPDPWPKGGAGSRLEGYAIGVPVVHLGVRFDEPSWGKAQPTLVEMPYLQVPRGTATSVEEYKMLCQRCLYDREFADSLAQDQLPIVSRVTSTSQWWRDLLACYSDWRIRSGASS